MIKSVLIICNNTEVIEPITCAMPEGVKVQVATALPAALATHKSQFDLVFIDVALTSDEFCNELAHVSRLFSDFNPMVPFLTRSSKVNVSAQEAGISTRQLSRLVAKYDLEVKAFKR